MGLSTDDVLSKPTEAQRLLAETEEVVQECRTVMIKTTNFLREAGTFDPESSVGVSMEEQQKACDEVLRAARESQVFIDNLDLKNITNRTIWDGPKRLEAMLAGIHRIKALTTAMRYGTEIANKINKEAKPEPTASPDPPSRLAHILPVETETEADRLLRKTEKEVERLKKALDRYASILISRGLKISDADVNRISSEQRKLCDEVLVAARNNKQIFDESKLSIADMDEGQSKFTVILRNMHDDLDRVSREASVLNGFIDKGLAAKNLEPVKIIPVTRATVLSMPPLVDAKREPEPSTSVVILADGHAFMAIDGVTEEFGGYNIRFILGDGIELHRSEFNQEGMIEFLRGHVSMFNIKEMVFQVVVTADKQVKICRKFLWKSANDPKTIPSCLNYALTYLV